MTRTASAWQTPHERRLLLALGWAIASATAFAHIAEDYLTNDPLARWDIRFAHWLAVHRTVAGTDALRVLTNLGSPMTALAISTVVFVVLYRRRLLLDALLLPVVLAGVELLNVILKLSFHRARPEVAFVHLDTYSFPSGHAMVSTAAYGALAYLAWSRMPTWRARIALLLGTTSLLALICFSRLYLGVHYLSDVLAGAAGGVFWLAVSVALVTVFGDGVVARLDGSRLDRLGRRLTRSGQAQAATRM